MCELQLTVGIMSCTALLTTLCVKGGTHPDFHGCDRAIPNPNLLIKSFAHRIKYLLKSIVLLYSPGSYANTLEAGPRAERWLQAYIPTNS